MSEMITEPVDITNVHSFHIDVTPQGGRMRSMSDMYSMDTPTSNNLSPLYGSNSGISEMTRYLSPTIPSIEGSHNQEDESNEINEIESTKIPIQTRSTVTHVNREKRNRLFSELSVSDMPDEAASETFPSLDISFPCSYEENMELRAKSIVQLRQAAIKRVVIRCGAKVARYNIVFSKDRFYWPQETIRHCRTGRIKRGMVLKRQFGVYYPDKSRELVAMKIMEKNAISECFQWDEDDVQLELGVMKELSDAGGHENVLFIHDSLETKEYLIAVMELVDGDLHDMLASIRGKDSVQDVFKQILLGYQYIVHKGYYHCDLSLENIAIKLVPNYLGTGKARLQAKISDFGRVKRMDSNGSAIIDGDEVAGKPYYLAPEAYSGSYEAGPADIWSLGIIFFILLTGNPPFGIANDSDEVFEPFSKDGFEYLIPLLEPYNITSEQIYILSKLLDLCPDSRPSVDKVLEMPFFS